MATSTDKGRTWIAVNSFLAEVDSEEAEVAAAYQNTMTLAQLRTAKKYHATHGARAALNFTDPIVFDLLTNELKNLCWELSLTTHAEIRGASGETPVATLAATRLDGVTPAQIQGIGKLLAELAITFEANARVLLDFWWGKARSLVFNETNMTIGTITVTHDTAVLPLLLFKVNINLENIAEMLLPQANAYQVEARYAGLQLDLSAYRARKAEITQQAKALIDANVKQTTLTF